MSPLYGTRATRFHNSMSDMDLKWILSAFGRVFGHAENSKKYLPEIIKTILLSDPFMVSSR